MPAQRNTHRGAHYDAYNGYLHDSTPHTFTTPLRDPSPCPIEYEPVYLYGEPIYCPSVRHAARLRRIPRPPNMFLIFRGWFGRVFGGRDHAQISRLAGERWQAMCAEERAPFVIEAARVRELHAQMYPGYKFVPSNGPKDKKAKAARQKKGALRVDALSAAPALACETGWTPPDLPRVDFFDVDSTPDPLPMPSPSVELYYPHEDVFPNSHSSPLLLPTTPFTDDVALTFADVNYATPEPSQPHLSALEPLISPGTSNFDVAMYAHMLYTHMLVEAPWTGTGIDSTFTPPIDFGLALPSQLDIGFSTSLHVPPQAPATYAPEMLDMYIPARLSPLDPLASLDWSSWMQ